MRLTLRTMLAYLDDVLDANEAQQIGKKISEVETASNLVMRIREAVSRPSLGAPKIGGRAVDANTVAEYLDNTLPADRVVDFERICLMDENDVYLAEVASCHQVLAEVLGDAAEVDPNSRTRMYGLLAEYDAKVAEAKAQAAKAAASENGGAAAATVATAAATPSDAATEAADVPAKKKREVPDYLRENDGGGGIWRAAAILLLGLLLAVVAVMAIGPQWLSDFIDGETQVADNTTQTTVVPADQGQGVAQTDTQPSTPAAPVAPATSGEPTAPGDTPVISPTAPVEAPPVSPTAPSDDPGNPFEPPPEGDAATPAAGTPATATPDRPAAATPAAGATTPAETVPPPQMTPGSTPGSTPAPPMPLPPEPMPPAGDATTPTEPPKVASVPQQGLPSGTPPADGAPMPATPAEEPAGERLGMLNSQQTILFRQPPGAREWQLVPVRGSAYVNDLLLSPPAYRNVLLLRDVALHLRGDTLVRVTKEDDLLKILVYYGRIEILANDADTQVIIKAGDQPPALVTFVKPASGLALECTPTREVGVNPEDTAPRYRVELFAAAGQFTWDAGEMDKVYDMAAKSRYVLGTKFEEPLPHDLPEWISSDEERRLIVRQSAEDLSNELMRLPNISVLQRLEELAYDEGAKVELRSLARRSLVALDRYQPAVAALRKYDRVERSAQFWPDYIDSLRKAVQRNRQSAKGVRETLVKLEGATEGLEAYRMLWGYTPEQLAAGEGDRLLSYLTHPDTIFRVLAEWNLTMLLNNDPRTTVTFHENDPPRLRPHVDGFRRKLAQYIDQNR